MRGLRTRGSLLWTFAGAFLAVLVGGIVLQAVLFAAILRPAMQRWRSATREAIAQTAAVAVAGAVEDGQGDLSAVLRSVAKDPSLVLVYRDEEGRLLSSHGPDPLPRWLRGGPRGQERPRGRGLAAVAPVLVDGQRRGK